VHDRVVRAFKNRALEAINHLKPREFEHFCRNLLQAYGFREVKVANVGRDGGIDGYGHLKMGLTFFKVAFQCKKWRHANVGRPEINQFRGDIQGQYEQGLFFTTARFTPDARKSESKPGAVTIVLIDGPTIVDFMIEKGFGVEKENLELYSLALDLAITEQP
jgi:restriction system protein